MLEITGKDIAELNDEDLRSLVGRLCESELLSHGLPTSGVTWGGNQNAVDGGIDVRVSIKDGVPPGGFVSRTSVGFQVKKTDFTPGLIGPEMRPSGRLRPSISNLIDEHGAYIIASSGSDTSDSALTDRLDAMRSAVADKTNHADLHIEFYDRNRLATWTRSHPGLVVWVRQKIGRGVLGWQPYASWAVSPRGVQDEYLIDDKANLHIGVADEKGIDVKCGIDRIRDILRVDQGVVRLVGLSGVGKTRLVQALFDERVGNNPLDPAAVVYTDMNDNPSPQPTGMISDLIASRTRAIVVVDNCAPDLHRRITEVCRASDSRISAVTVEYDVREDEPEGTEVFRLEPSSIELVFRLIEHRFPSMTRLDVDKIAEFSGGNARVALALANTLGHHESVAGLRDEELFKRLFHQRQGHDDTLIKAAQACSLLYSFQGEAIIDDDAELPKIAALVGMTARHLFAMVSQLKQRDLVQRRGVWRAILPHAVANRLARMALTEIPLATIEQEFDTGRLMKSFSRRLGYLHESAEARCLAEKWLAKDGMLGEVYRLNELGLEMFGNIAPISPEATLAAVERSLSGPNASELLDELRRDRIGSVLHLIAYDASLFDRCVTAMIELALDEEMDRSHPIRNALEGLFHILLSGTHASIEQRTGITKGLLCSNEPVRCSLGLQLLKALLKAHDFSAARSFDFGARVRDYGYWPRAREERSHWFATALSFAGQFASKKDDTAATVRSLIAQSISNIWFLSSEVQEQLEAIASEIATNHYWEEGWIAVRFALSQPSDAENAAAIERLRSFETRLRPRSIVDQVRAVVLLQREFDYVLMDDETETETNKVMSAYERNYAAAEELGKAVGSDQAVFAALLPDLVKGNAARLFPFGKGLALASGDSLRIWSQLTLAVAATDETKRNLEVFCGFLNGLSTVDHELTEALLETAIVHETLGVWFPYLQSSVVISPRGVDRLKKAASLGKARAGAFRFLGCRNRSDALSGDDLRIIVLSLAHQQSGFGAAIDILSMRFHSVGKQKAEFPSELTDAGRILLSNPDFSVRGSSYDYDLCSIATVCLDGADGVATARSLCKCIKKGLVDYSVHAYNYEQLLQCIFKLQSRTALDVFFGDTSQTHGSELDMTDFVHLSHSRKQPLDGVPIAEMLRWCDEQPAVRYPAIARVVPYQTPAADGSGWTPLAMEMLQRAPDPVAVLETFVSRFDPTSWSGSRAAIVESRLGLLGCLTELRNPLLDNYVERTRLQIVDKIARIRESENNRDSWRDERFE